MIDVHCHLLPGLDDGPRDEAKALEMARLAVDGGTRGIICTPHRHRQVYPNTRTVIDGRVAALQTVLDAHDVPLSLWSGCELALDVDLVDGLLAGELATLGGGNWILLELPGMVRPVHVERFMQQLMDAGYRIILAHPERYRYVQTDPGIVYDWVMAGVCIQLTAGQVAEDAGRSGALTTVLLEHNLVQFLASDGHGTGWRAPLLRDGARVAEFVVGADAVARMMCDNPRAVVNNDVLSPVMPAPVRVQIRKKSWFTLW